VDAVARCRGDQHGRVAQTGDEQPHATQVEHCIGAGHRLGQHRAGLGRGQVALGHKSYEHEVVAQREREPDGPVIDPGRGDETTEHAGRRVLRVAVVGGRDREGVVGSRGGGGGRGERSGRPQAPGHRDLGVHCDREPVVPEHVRDDPGGEMRRVVEEARTLPRGVHGQGVGRLHVHADVAVEGNGQGVEPGPEVG